MNKARKSVIESPGLYEKKSDLDVEIELSDNDANVSDVKKVKSLSFLSLFRFATLTDKVLIAIGLVSALLGGLSIPFMIILFGDLANTFVSHDLNSTVIFDSEEFMEGITHFGQGSALIGLLNCIFGYIFVSTLNLSAERQVFQIRRLFLESILRQNIGWYDMNCVTGDFASGMTDDLNKLQEGIGEKIGLFVFFLTIFVASMINAFIHGWELALVILSAMPILMIAVGIIAKSQTAMTEKELKAYGQAGSVVEEALSSIRTVVAFQGQKKEVERYESNLQGAQKASIMRGLLTAIGGGFMWLIIYSSYAIAFWYGVKLIMDERERCGEIEENEGVKENCTIRYDSSSLLIVFFSVLMGAMNVGQASPYVEAFSMATGAAYKIFKVIDRVSEIDSGSDKGSKLSEFKGSISFKNVSFFYPTREEVKVLSDISFSVEAGTTMAIVGQSGCGKSTLIQLLLRFYDPMSGIIAYDDTDLRTLSVKWLREQIGIVSQEPVLFGCTIRENLEYGLTSVSQTELDDATQKANAFDFIQKLPLKYETLVGERGAHLSGGQKQRIAIARALLRNPRILLLDEATSALDTQSESTVQSALDFASKGRTTLIIAHRLSTIMSAHKILVLNEGKVVEIGTHDELFDKKSVYYSLFMAQMSKVMTVKNNFDDENDDFEKEENDFEKEECIENCKKENKDSQERNSTTQRVNSAEKGLSNESPCSKKSFREKNVRDDEPATYLHVNQNESPSMKSKKSLSSDKDSLPEVGFYRLIKENSSEWIYIGIGALSSGIMGSSMPVYAILFGEVLGVLSMPIDEARSNSVYYSILFFVVGIIVGAAMFFQILGFCIAGEKLTTKMRVKSFKAILNQEMSWYDDPNHYTGVLCSKLASDASAIQGATGSRLGAIIHVMFTLILSLSAALYFNVKLGLVGACFVPAVLLGAWFQARIITSQNNLEQENLSDSAKLAIEAITNIRTIAGLQLESTFVTQYFFKLQGPHECALKNAHIRGLIFGLAQSIPFFAYAGCMVYGGYLVKYEELPYKDVFKVAEALVLGTLMVGQGMAFTPNYAKAKAAAARIFVLLDRKPLMNFSSGSIPASFTPNIEFKNLGFTYPSRKTIKIFRDLSFSIQAGSKVALVGLSGSGKSTIIQLLQRFYELSSGELLIDGHDIKSYNVSWLRSQIGIVSQEPDLFDRSLADNIRYGDNSRDVTLDEIIDVAKQANIHSFISNLPQGYETKVGSRGSQLSGGQKQRVAIARALIRKPSLLLLDEATSALDSASEKIVQEALESAQVGKTSITVAHRLTTLQNMDQIIVIDHGNVVEIGSHEQLISQKGLYGNLWNSQKSN